MNNFEGKVHSDLRSRFGQGNYRETASLKRIEEAEEREGEGGGGEGGGGEGGGGEGGYGCLVLGGVEVVNISFDNACFPCAWFTNDEYFVEALFFRRLRARNQANR